MNVNVFIREIVVHDTSDPGDGDGEYDVVFAAYPEGDGSAMKVTPRWTNTVRRAESYEVLHWLGPFDVPPAVNLVLVAGGREHDLVGTDRLQGGVAYLNSRDHLGASRWWRTTNGKHFDFTFTVTPAEEQHAGRPPYTGQVGEIQPAPGPGTLTAADYPPGLE